jgi:hypothetical protein
MSSVGKPSCARLDCFVGEEILTVMQFAYTSYARDMLTERGIPVFIARRLRRLS